MSTPKSLQFENAGYFLAGLLILVFLGFWNSYFSKFFVHSEGLNFYFHFHAVIAFLWISMVIVQPILIKKKKFKLHRQIGKSSYVLISLVFISVLLLVHSRHSLDEDYLGFKLLVPFKDLIILGTAYFIAMRYRKNVSVHARAMIATGIVFIEPSLLRVIRNYFDVGAPYLVTALVVYALLITLMIIERKQKNGRWVFPLIFLLYLAVHSILFFGIRIGILDSFAKWFIGLPLT